MKLKQNFFVKCGEWSQPSGLNITDYEALFEGNQMNTTLVVTTIIQVPYVMMHTSKNITGNARFYGFCVDLLERISKQIGFNYILDLVHDRKVNLSSFCTYSILSLIFIWFFCSKSNYWSMVQRMLMATGMVINLLSSKTFCAPSNEYKFFIIFQEWLECWWNT